MLPHHVQHAAGLEAGAGALVGEGHGDAHADLLAGREALEVHVQRPVGDGVELHVAHQGALGGADRVHGVPLGARQMVVRVPDPRGLRSGRARGRAAHVLRR